MNSKIKIAIADDHELFREGVKQIIEKLDEFEIAGEASNGKEMLKLCSLIDIHIILMDISMPEMDGIQATTEIMKQYPDKLVIALTMFGDQKYYHDMIQAGAKGFILKKSGRIELINALQAVHSGKSYISQELLQNMILGNKKDISAIEKFNITEREIDILRELCTGKNQSEIADGLFISQRTVQNHVSNLLEKTGYKNSIGLVMFAIKNKLVEL